MNSWLFFAILAPFLWGSSNVVDAVILRHYVKSDRVMTWFASMYRLPFVLLAFALFGFDYPDLYTLILMLLSGFLWVLPLIFYFRAIEHEEPSRVALFIQLLPIFTLLIAFLMIGEKLQFSQLIAFVFLIIGGILAALKKLEGVWHVSKALLWIVLASFVWAFSDVLFKKLEPSFETYFTAFSIYLLGSFLVAIVFSSNKTKFKKMMTHFKKLPFRAWVMIVFTQTAGIAGMIAFTYALTIGKASLTAVLLGSQPLFAFLFGAVLSPFVREVQMEDVRKQALILKTASFALVIAGLIILQL